MPQYIVLQITVDDDIENFILQEGKELKMGTARLPKEKCEIKLIKIGETK